jgi:hypothetical protein
MEKERGLVVTVNVKNKEGKVLTTKDPKPFPSRLRDKSKYMPGAPKVRG